MSSVLHPVGPERPGVYWLRRGLLLVIVLALLLLIVHAVAGGTASTGAGAGPPAHSSGSPRPSATSTVASPSRSPTPRCTAADLSATLGTDRLQYAAGEDATFTATIHDVSGAPCRLHSTDASRTWTVTSGHDTIWTTAGCSHTGKPTSRRLTATRTVSLSIVWDAHRNDSSCTTGAAALPGTYVLSATFGGVTAKPTVFHVVS